jgi:hypothetical protein
VIAVLWLDHALKCFISVGVSAWLSEAMNTSRRERWSETPSFRKGTRNDR